MIKALTVLDEMIGALSGNGPSKDTLILRDKISQECDTVIATFSEELFLRKHRNGWEFLLYTGTLKDALFFSRSVLEVLYTHFEKIHLPSFSLRSQLEIFVVSCQWDRKHFIRNAKFFTAYPMARYLSNDLPLKPPNFLGHPLIFKGKLRRFLKSRLISRSDRNASLFLSLLLGVKKGTAVVNEEFQKASFLEHREKMQRSPNTDWSHHVSFQECLLDFFDGFKCGRARLFQASSSAAFGCTRGEGGALSYIQETFGEGPNNLIKIVEVSPGCTEEIRGFQQPSLSDVLCFVKGRRDGIFHDPSFPNILRGPPSSVKVSAVLEPLKCRLITKGDPCSYFLSRFFQKALWSFLFSMEPFRLIGKPLDSSDIYSLLEREKKCFSESERECLYWISGDYSAATDALNMDYTKAVMEEALSRSRLNEEIKISLRSVIYEQEVHYPKSFNRRGELDPVLQKNGQLMGSTLSFPILCIVNYLAYYMSLVTFYPDREFDIHNLPCLVNGDDILFRASPNFYNHWKEMVKKVGFELSLGKNYCHKRYLTVNSQMYRHCHETGKIIEIKHLNCGLLIGKAKTGDARPEEKRPIWDIYNKLVDNCPNPERVHRRFIHYNKHLIQECTLKGNYNLFLTFDQGGLGFQNERVPRNYTNFQRRFASFLREEQDDMASGGKVPDKSLGLVTRREQGLLKRKRTKVLTRMPFVGPLPEGWREVSSLDIPIPMNTSPLPLYDRDDYYFQLPKTSMLRRFRMALKKEAIPLMKLERLGFQWDKWVEVDGVPRQLSLGSDTDENEEEEEKKEPRRMKSRPHPRAYDSVMDLISPLY